MYHASYPMMIDSGSLIITKISTIVIDVWP